MSGKFVVDTTLESTEQTLGVDMISTNDMINTDDKINTDDMINTDDKINTVDMINTNDNSSLISDNTIDTEALAAQFSTLNLNRRIAQANTTVVRKPRMRKSTAAEVSALREEESLEGLFARLRISSCRESRVGGVGVATTAGRGWGEPLWIIRAHLERKWGRETKMRETKIGRKRARETKKGEETMREKKMGLFRMAMRARRDEAMRRAGL